MWGGCNTLNDVTHLCLFDIPVLTSIPNLIYLAPTTCEEYFAMLRWAIRQDKKPIAIRVPSNGIVHTDEIQPEEFSFEPSYKITQKGSQVAIIAAGSFYQKGEHVASLLAEKGIKPTLINPRYFSGVDENMLDALKTDHQLVVTLEDGCKEGGFGQRVATYYSLDNMKVLVGGFRKELHDRFVVQQLLSDNRLLDEQLVEDIIRIVG